MTTLATTPYSRRNPTPLQERTPVRKISGPHRDRRHLIHLFEHSPPHIEHAIATPANHHNRLAPHPACSPRSHQSPRPPVAISPAPPQKATNRHGRRRSRHARSGRERMGKSITGAKIGSESRHFVSIAATATRTHSTPRDREEQHAPETPKPPPETPRCDLSLNCSRRT